MGSRPRKSNIAGTVGFTERHCLATRRLAGATRRAEPKIRRSRDAMGSSDRTRQPFEAPHGCARSGGVSCPVLTCVVKNASSQLVKIYDRVLDETVQQTEFDMAAPMYALGRHDVNETVIADLRKEIEDLRRQQPTTHERIQGSVKSMRRDLNLEAERQSHRSVAALNSLYVMTLMQVGMRYPDSVDIFEHLREQIGQQKFDFPLPLRTFTPQGKKE